MAADVDRISGKAGFFTYNDVVIPFTKFTPKVTRTLGNTTDSADYSQSQDMIGTTQIPITYTVDGTIEGRYRKSSTPSVFIANAFNSLTQIPIAFGLDFTTNRTLMSGAADLSDFQVDEPVDEIVTWSCSVKSWGIWTPNA